VPERIIIRGAGEHNLRGVDLDIPKNALIVFTGVSGSGKSSLAFDTLFAEGQRRYVESLSPYARQFLQQLPRPKVRYLEGLAPSIAINQGTRSHNPRSTVATVTEVYDYLRVLYAAIGKPHCHQCGRPIGAQTREAIIGRIEALKPGTRLMILAPLAHGRKGEFRDLFEDMMKLGYMRARVDGEVIELGQAPALDRLRKHNIEVVLDRVRLDKDSHVRVAEAVDAALELSEGDVIVAPEGGKDILLSRKFACRHCDISFSEPTHASFSFNAPRGMCPECQGLGILRRFDPELLVPDQSKSLRQHAVKFMRSMNNRFHRHYFEGVARHYGFTLDTPWKDLTDLQRDRLLYGTGDEIIQFEVPEWGWRHSAPWAGIVHDLTRRLNRMKVSSMRGQLEALMRTGPCPACHGRRLRPESLAVTIARKNIAEIVEMTVEQAHRFFREVKLDPVDEKIAADALKEIRDRLGFLVHVGLHYLTLDRSARTLAGGEAQRIRLASQVGGGLVDCMYILDEPSIGLHHRDQRKLLETLLHLRNLDNTVIVVEHDEQTMLAADWIVDFGPGAGTRGGEVVSAGTPAQVRRDRHSLTGQYLSGKMTIPLPESRRPGNGKALTVRGARLNNLRGIDVRFPLERFIAVTGVSGSGKSSLVTDILYPALADKLHGAELEAGPHDGIDGIEHLRKVIMIDQDPIGRTPRSNPATYTGVFDHIRALFAELPESRVRGYKPGRFSFNVAEGRCPACEGHGAVRLESDFLADVWVECETCGGKRFDRETLAVQYKGKSIAEVLDLEVGDALEHFASLPPIRRILQTLVDVGLGYITLGQPATTLSGGEAQRVKLAKELARPTQGGCLYILDEPTTGLHFDDVRQLLEVLHRFVEQANTVIVVEHHPDIVKSADYVVDLGPEGGEGGGRVIATGTPEEVARSKRSHTGAMLREILGQEHHVAPPEHHRKRLTSDRRGSEAIEVYGAREHNLKGVDVRLPRRKLNVLTGVSGSGKTSMALDTIYAEGQRRYVESLSSYARQFVEQMPKPKADRVAGLSPAIAIDQTGTPSSPRSTVGTVTEIYDYLRVLYARLGEPHCPACGGPVGARTVDTITDSVIATCDGQTVLVLSPVKPAGTEQYMPLLERAHREGWRRARVDGIIETLPLSREIDRRRKHSVQIVVDRLSVGPERRGRIAEAVERAVEMSEGEVVVAPESGEELAFSRDYGCRDCGRSYEELTPKQYSFNRPEGWCPLCEGLGTQTGVDTFAIVPDPSLTLRQGAVDFWGALQPGTLLARFVQAIADAGGFDLDTPYASLTHAQKDALLSGIDEELDIGEGIRTRFIGLLPGIEEASRLSWHYRRLFGRAMGEVPCPACDGARIKPEPAATRFRDKTLPELCRLPLDECAEFVNSISLSAPEEQAAGDVFDEIRSRLNFLVEVGLEYLTLNRPSPSLSGGEAQRVRLAGQMGSGLTGVLYVLDEPTVGVHPRDNDRMIHALESLRELGNTVLVVEHDPQLIARADHLVDFGPGAGPSGGRVIAAGSPAQIAAHKDSVTGQFIAGTRRIEAPEHRRPLPPPQIDGKPAWITIAGAAHHNLKHVTAHVPLGVFTCVTGPSGSGKSSLINDILFVELAYQLHGRGGVPGHHRAITGIEAIEKIINIDQSPIGHSPRSNPAIYVGAFDRIRAFFAMLPEARVRGFKPGRFSFNAKGGRCEACQGMGARIVEMHFLPDVLVPCEVCGGKRFNQETLEVRYRGKNIADVLEMTVGEALELFANFRRIVPGLRVLADVGLGHVPLGQAAPTLSGGEAQRVKLASELSRPSRGRTLYLLDEPTTGLHLADIQKLLDVLNRLVNAGNTVVVIEHNMDFAKTADFVIDLGPEGGDRGGYIVATGTPEEIAANPKSATAKYLREALGR
jgi:excinuclease ABC subunit A